MLKALSLKSYSEDRVQLGVVRILKHTFGGEGDCTAAYIAY